MSDSTRQAITVWRWSIAIGGALLFAWKVSRLPPGQQWLAALAIAILLFFLVPLLIQRRYLAKAERDLLNKDLAAAIRGVKTIAVTGEGLATSSDAGRQLLNFAMIKSVEETEKHVFISGTSPNHGYVIPKGGLSTTDVQAFVVALRERITGSGGP